MNASGETAQVLSGFDDPRCSAARWNALLARGDTNAVFLTAEWQRAWWDWFERSGLLLIAVERAGELVAIAPFFAEEGMVYFVGSGGSDYLGFVGDISAPDVLDSILLAARASTPNFVGFRLYHIPDRSRTGEWLAAAAARLGLILRDEGTQPAPATALGIDHEADYALAKKKSLLRHENYFRREGELVVRHLTLAGEIEPHLGEFFDQHIRRWNVTPYPSLFLNSRQQRFYRTLTTAASDAGWLRFTRLDWNDRPIAFHFGFHREGNFMWYKPSFEIELSRHSPGEVLIRQLLLRTIEEGAHTFDFGLGDEAFKQRFANQTLMVRNFGLFPAGAPLPEVW